MLVVCASGKVQASGGLFPRGIKVAVMVGVAVGGLGVSVGRMVSDG